MLHEGRLDQKVGLHIEVPERVRRQVRSRAALEGLSIRDWLLAAIGEKLEADETDGNVIRH